MATLRATAILIIFVVTTLICIPLQSLALKLDSRLRQRIPLFYHRFFCALMGARVKIIGTPAAGGVLLSANHAGWLDIPILSAITPVSFVAKQEVGAWRFFGTLARLQRTIFVRRVRTKAKDDRDSIHKRLTEGEAVVIFPEGTSSDGNRVLPFKSSLFSVAELPLGEDKEHHAIYAPVQPVSVAYVGLHGLPMGRENRPFFAWYGDMELVPHLWQAWEMGPIDVVVEFHKPVTIGEAGGRKQLAAAAEAAVRDGVVRALTGGSAAPPAHTDETLIEALEEEEAEPEEAP
jgi:1-acyl-sn-glycerol-3-phosphate acyltransferase